ncbi:alpha/beta fold hydrolase [Cryptosporangium phraense]|uniref:alpha/beta fold hydrolase n=1 Tax=Cryptosporangium phraense TaxID=2593070 RepID=UPI00197A9008|nr:alpha/beta hydrolase [Cryptosporangium phraense]
MTVFAHGLGGSIADARPLGSGVRGTRVFFSFRGHGASEPLPPGWTYRDLADDLETVADEHRATRALGTSLGAGALTRLVADRPGRFERLVFFLPAALDRPRPADARDRFAALAAALDDGDLDRLAAVVTLEVPEASVGTPAARAYVRQRVEALRRPGLVEALRRLPTLTVLPSPDALRAVEAPALVLGCQGDPLHPESVAEHLADALPNAELHIYGAPGVLWNQRSDLRRRISEFLR